jgi:hypothetical protein
MSITKAGQSRGNKRFLSGKQIQQYSTVLDTCIVLSILFSQLFMNKMKQQAVPIQALSFSTCTRHISISICVCKHHINNIR